MRTRQDIRPNPMTELWHFKTPVQIEKSNQSEPTDDVSETIHLQNQTQDDIFPFPSARQDTRYSVYPRI